MTERSNKDFFWTDELVKKFVTYHSLSGSTSGMDIDISKFKDYFSNTYTSKDNLQSGSNVAGGKDIEDIRFGMWLNENGWQFYDGHDRLINLKAGNAVLPITELFADYKKENPEP